MLSRYALILVLAIDACCASASAQEVSIEEISSVLALPIDRLKRRTVAFNDFRNDRLADTGTGLVRFDDWAGSRPVQKQILSLHPGYSEPFVKMSSNGVTTWAKQRLHMYVAEARLVLYRSPSSIDLARYATPPFLAKLDPAVKHRAIAAADAMPLNDPEASHNRHPDRIWCEVKARAACIQSRYQFEGKFSGAILLANKLREADKKIADYVEFQSEVRVLSPNEFETVEFAKLTHLNAAITGVLEQSIFWVNQIMVFGKFLAVMQQHPTESSATVATAFMAFGIKSDVLDGMKEYENVPVLNNLVPAQVLVGRSSLNSGNSISAGLPVYARNRVMTIGGLLERE